MKRLLLCLMATLLMLPAHAETEAYTGRVREDMPILTVTVTQDGSFDDTALRPCTLTAQGARNVFYAFALWNPLQAQFDEVMPGGADMYQDTAVNGMTGYIWHSFLEETER